MMIRVNGEYLDFDDDIEIEEQIKLFEEIDTSNGDYSYSFSLSKTNFNLKILGIPYPDTRKTIYTDVLCDIIDNTGQKQKTGTLRVERINANIECSFFGGNNNWFSLLVNPLSSLPLHKYDVERTAANVQASWTKNYGLVFPLVDSGVLSQRVYASTVPEDYTPFIYVKTLFKEIFNSVGIKLTGDLLQDQLYQKLTMGCANKSSEDDLDSRSTYAKKNIIQSISAADGLSKVLYQDDTTPPYFDGSQNNFLNSTYTADIKMRLQVDLVIKVAVAGPSSGLLTYGIYINGSAEKTWSISFSSSGITKITLTKSRNVIIEAGDTLEIRAIVTGVGNILFVYEDSTIKVTPNYSYGVYNVSASSAVPNWTQGEFVSNILRLLNVMASYNTENKTLTLNLFKNLKNKESIDISDQVTIEDTDYCDFISNYANDNIFSYSDSSVDEAGQYNAANALPNGSGKISTENAYIEKENDVLQSDFCASISYIHTYFDASLEKLNFVDLEEIDSKTISSVTDASGVPRFNISSADNLFSPGDIVRIDTGIDSNFEYNGDWVVDTVTSSYITVVGGVYGTSADGTATLMNHVFTTSQDVYLMVNIPSINVGDFSSISSVYIDSTAYTQTSLAYFNMLSNNSIVNSVYKQGLSFGAVNNPLSFQISLLETYWGLFGDILNDPVMLKMSCYFKRSTYDQMRTFLRPLRIKTNETNNLYYLNRIRGYKDSSTPCYAEVIKL